MKMPKNMSNGFSKWGGYMAAKVSKLEEQFTLARAPLQESELFKGISIYVNGLTDPSADELKRIMIVHGGIYHNYELPNTTYIIAKNLPDVKVRNMDTSKIISAQWVVESVKEQRILDYTSYLLYTNQKSNQPPLTFYVKPKVVDSSNSVEMKSESDLSLSPHKLIVSELNGECEHNVLPLPTDIQQCQKDGGGGGGEENESKIIPAKQSTVVGSSSRTAVDPEFLAEFYTNSRLHHIASLGAGFKQYVCELRMKQNTASFPGREQLKLKLPVNGLSGSQKYTGKYIMHIDMDCFFVSVGLRKHEHLRGQPVAVTHSKGSSSSTDVPIHPEANRQVEMTLLGKRLEQQQPDGALTEKVRDGFEGKMSLSEIACCSYEARAKGISNGMFFGQALKLCPELKAIPYDFDGYKEVAQTLYDTIAQYTLNIEAVSCDEMFVDLLDVLHDVGGPPMSLISVIREEVLQKTGCTCSAGIGGNKLQARMATKRAKPNGQYSVIDEDIESYMADIPIADLPGIGNSHSYTLCNAGYNTCGDLQNVSLTQLQQLMGKKLGETLYQGCRGIDNRPLVYEQLRKSVSAEINYGIRFRDNTEMERFVQKMCVEVQSRLLEIKRKSKYLTLKVMVRAKDAPREAAKYMGHGICDNLTKSISMSEFTDNLETITRTALSAMRSLAVPPTKLRGIGIQLSKLDTVINTKEKKENIIMDMFWKAVQSKKDDDDNNEGGDKHVDSIKVVERAQPSPIVRSTARTMARRRGYATTIKNSKRSNLNNNMVLSMLQKAVAKENAESVDVPALVCPPGVDPAVFKELPEEIQAEIVGEYENLHYINSNHNLNIATNDMNTLADRDSSLSLSELSPSTSKAAADNAAAAAATAANAAAITATINCEESTEIETEFLDALPADLREEIENDMIEQRRLDLWTTNALPYETEPTLLQANSSATSAQQSQLQQQQESARMVMNGELDSNNIFGQEKWKELLIAWVQSTNVPEGLDVKMMCRHAQQYVRLKRIDELYDVLTFLYRLIKCLNNEVCLCAWHGAYDVIMKAVQKEMDHTYLGRRLYQRQTLKCDKCFPSDSQKER